MSKFIIDGRKAIRVTKEGDGLDHVRQITMELILVIGGVVIL